MSAGDLTNRTFDEIEPGASASATHTMTATDVEALALAAGDVEGFHLEHGEPSDRVSAQGAAAVVALLPAGRTSDRRASVPASRLGAAGTDPGPDLTPPAVGEVLLEADEVTRRADEALQAASVASKANNSEEAVARYTAAVAQYDQGLAADPDQPAILTNKAVALKGRGVEKFNATVRSKTLDDAGRAAGLQAVTRGGASGSPSPTRRGAPTRNAGQIGRASGAG